MPLAHSYRRSFEINKTAFSHYHAQDTHGTVTDSYTIDHRSVTREEFMAGVQYAVSDAEFYILTACGMIKSKTPDWKV